MLAGMEPLLADDGLAPEPNNLVAPTTDVPPDNLSEPAIAEVVEVSFKVPKCATVSEQESGVFTLEYDNTVGKKHSMRLDAATYEKALREARSYLGIDEGGLDEAGDQWVVE